MRRHLKKFSALVLPSKESYYASSLIALVACLVITGWVWNTANNNLEQDIGKSLVAATTSAEQSINATLMNYSEVLMGAASFLNATNSIDEDRWQQYISNLELAKQRPGLQAVAYSEVVNGDNLQSFLETTTNQYTGRPIEIRPATPRDVYVPTRLIEPYNDRTDVAIGYDAFTEPIRRKAMEQARDINQPVITGRLTLVQDNKRQSGFIIFMPMYRPDAPLTTTSERQAAITGYISAGVRSQELIEGLFGKAITPDSALQIYDGTLKNPDNLIYQSSTYGNLVKQRNISSSTQVFKSGNKEWTIATYVNQNFASKTQREQPQQILIGGLVFSVLITILLFILMTSRARAITNQKNSEVLDAKDNLISLASHQLRTPATGVKQFVGMVLEGYAGKITSRQRSMLDKAYLSNERQLETINQILHVTKVDSGRMVIRKQKVDVVKIIDSVLGEYEQTLKSMKQVVTFKPHKKVIYLMADNQYLPIVIDNLISNASKYSPPDSPIEITVKQLAESVIINVTDSGVGINSKDMHLLFQKFSRIQNILSVEAGGNGIGLYLCKEIVSLHGGSIAVESEVNHGTGFTVILPRKN